ncbi:MAG: hypothetical protein M3Q07_25330 [Pseudobdellovibrionaceae bacterium]|nr:hypothetical protein [Pseudobdellovibrionaceae bacterium]
MGEITQKFRVGKKRAPLQLDEAMISLQKLREAGSCFLTPKDVGSAFVDGDFYGPYLTDANHTEYLGFHQRKRILCVSALLVQMNLIKPVTRYSLATWPSFCCDPDEERTKHPSRYETFIQIGFQ